LQAPPIPSDDVVRPEPGLARGRWEAPAWAFYAVAAAALLGGLAWLAVALRTRTARFSLGVGGADSRRRIR
jgi:hypothetical protein